MQRSDHQIDLVPVALLRLEEHEHEIGPDRKVRGLGADDERREVVLCLLDRGVEHRDRVAADGVHLRVEVHGQDAVADVHQAGAGIAPHDAFPLFSRPKNLKVGRRRGHRSIAETIGAALEDVRDEGRCLFDADGFEDVANPEGVPCLERTELPAEAPPHRPVDIVNRVGNFRRRMRRVDESRPQGGPQKGADPVRSEEQRPDPFADIVNRFRGIEGGQLHGLLRAVRRYVAGSSVRISAPSFL